MIHTFERGDRMAADVAVRSMFAARKEVFIDLLKWDLSVRNGKFEIDRFDSEHARYLILTTKGGNHLGSARLLSTLTPHILDTLFPDLSEAEVPRGEAVFEITRFCLDRHLKAAERRVIRNTLISALVEYALSHGITSYTGVAELGWLHQILRFGWDCVSLGPPIEHGGMHLGALKIQITSGTPRKLAEAGFWSPPSAHELSTVISAAFEEF